MTTPLVGIVRRVRFGLGLLGILSAASSLLLLVSPLYTMQVYDRVITTGHIETLVVLSVAIVGVLAFMALLDTLRGLGSARIQSWIDKSLSLPVLAAALEEKRRGREVHQQALRDLAQVRALFAGQSLLPFFDLPWSLLFGAVVWAVHPWLGMFALASVATLSLITFVGHRLVRGQEEQTVKAMVEQAQLIEDVSRNAEVVRALGMMPAMAQRWENVAGRLRAHQESSGNRTAWLMGLSKTTRIGVQMGIMGLGAYLAIRNEITVGAMFATSILLGRVLAPFEQVLAGWRNVALGLTSFRRLERLLASLPEPPRGVRLPPPQGRITFEGVACVPPGATRPSLRGVSLEIQPGTCVAVVGPSASGKSSLCRLVTGVWKPVQGRVRIDGADAAPWSDADLGRHLGYLPQDVELFAGTVRQNIARFADVSDDMVIAAATLAGAHELVLGLPDGYATPVAPGGASLSGGQRQRIGLARALLGSPRILVLDEPNANLDQDGEAALLQALSAMKDRGSTILLVVHRPSLLGVADKILVLTDGTAQMYGPRDEVLPRLARPRPAPSTAPAKVAS